MNNTNLSQTPERLLSLDFFRGITMFLLIGEMSGLYEHLIDPSLKGSVIYWLGMQFQHHDWHGLRFWDLVQPFFMFIVGVALPFSVAKREKKGESKGKILGHVILRSFLLLLFGWALYCIGPGRITFRFQNVLAQLSVTYLIAYLLMNKPLRTQIIVSFALIVANDLIYRFFWLEGFNHPFEPDQNFGAWFDLLISGELSSGHWVSFNAIPTAAHTIWGVLAGKLLMGPRKPLEKVKILAIAGVIGLVCGYALDLAIPIIKRISTGSFVIVSGGWCFAALALSYLVIDVWKKRRWSVFFAIVGANSLFIYLFAHTAGTQWLHSIIKPFSAVLFGWMGDLTLAIISCTIVWFLMWGMCWWLWKRKIFIKI